MLMGRLLDQWYGYGRIYPIPLTTLPEADQKRIVAAVPKEWLFPDKAQEAFYRINIGELDAGQTLLKEAVLAGEWRWSSARCSPKRSVSISGWRW